ncbi:NADP-dependent oxidoreductase domain-containing protein [Aspergillus lucknowensis]|uniref:NADP-dependent oxidoreductase domain-containing protein n=1 Tax=Aspergillus lucknowensis TaxID=176173 RepID=A0ABR4LR83_9EURO
MGKCKKEEAFALMDAFYDMGGNFIDTANNYQEGNSEMWIGEWMESRGNRDQMVVVKVNGYARANGLRPFSLYQGLWNPLRRDMESEIVLISRDQGMGIAPWGPLAQGKLKAAESRMLASGGRSDQDMTEDEIRVSEVLDEVAKSKDTTLPAVALAYLLHKSPSVVPKIGQRKIEHLAADADALRIELSKEEMDKIDTAVPFDPGHKLHISRQIWLDPHCCRCTIDTEDGAYRLTAPTEHHPTKERGMKAGVRYFVESYLQQQHCLAKLVF